jgi:hypothetical protein
VNIKIIVGQLHLHFLCFYACFFCCIILALFYFFFFFLFDRFSVSVGKNHLYYSIDDKHPLFVLGYVGEKFSERNNFSFIIINFFRLKLSNASMARFKYMYFYLFISVQKMVHI